VKNSTFKSALLGFALCGLTLSPAVAQETTMPSVGPLDPVKPEKIETVDVDPALWVVKDADTTIYLFGTVHVLKPGLGWFDEGVKDAFDKSDQLVLELVQPPASEIQVIMADLSIDKSGRSLRSKLNEKDRAAYEALVKKMGVPVEAFDPIEPWAIAVSIYALTLGASGFDPNLGVEAQLTAAATAKNKPIIGLETMRGQLGIFDQLSEPVQLDYLNQTVATIDQVGAQTDALVTHWSKPDPEALAALVNEGFSDPKLYEQLLTRRNANWAAWIRDRMAKPGNVFVAVGAGHLAGPASVQQLLTAYGLDSERVRY
jgi:uncharacterized protein YbaP (TraB family)